MIRSETPSAQLLPAPSEHGASPARGVSHVVLVRLLGGRPARAVERRKLVRIPPLVLRRGRGVFVAGVFRRPVLHRHRVRRTVLGLVRLLVVTAT